MLEERERDRLGAILRNAVAARDELAVVLGMDDERICEREEARSQRSHVAARERALALAHVLGLVELDHHAGAHLARDAGEREVVVEDRARPPLEDDDLGARPAQERRRLARATATEYQSTPSSTGMPGFSPISVICAPTRVRPGYSRRGSSRRISSADGRLCSSRALTSANV